MATGPVEKYQLKWHSHVANLNSSVATLFRNEKFADVILMTSNQNQNETCGIIPAHRFILGTCSHYFSTLFEASPVQSANSLIYIILPPELTKRALEILVQYMYCGEATVHNDVLNEVLKGGEILKIRGLWRNGSSDYVDHLYQAPHFNHQQQAAPPPPPPHPGPSNGGAYERERPVVVRNSNQEESQRRSSPVNRSAYYPGSTVYVKKDSSSSSSCETCRISSLHGNEPRVAMPPVPGPSPPPPPLPESFRSPLTENQNFINSQGAAMNNYRRSAAVAGQSKCIKPFYHPPKAPLIEMEGTFSLPDRERQIIKMNPSETPFGDQQQGSFPAQDNLIHRSAAAPGNLPVIKQEPRDWPTEGEPPVVEVKRELVYNEEDPEEGCSGGEEMPMYTPLTCELCKEVFTVPAEWVRHIENHAETPQTVPKKRRRTEEMNNENMTSLKCDLCSMYFVAPSEWVRHIQNSHTENELALSNSCLAKASSFSNGDTMEENCVVCTKSKYPSGTASGSQKGADSSDGC